MHPLSPVGQWLSLNEHRWLSSGERHRAPPLRLTGEKELRRKVRVKDSQGTEYSPIDPGNLPTVLRDILRGLEPRLGQILGATGQGTHFLVFPSTDISGHTIADATREGVLVLGVGNHEMRWSLPLVATEDARPPDGNRISALAVSGDEAEQLGYALSTFAGSFTSAAFFGMFATEKAYSHGGLTRKQAFALTKRYASDAQSIRSELGRLAFLFCEDGEEATIQMLSKACTSIIAQADALGRHVNAGDANALQRYERERGTFMMLFEEHTDEPVEN